MINLGNIELADLRLGASQVKAVYFGSEQIWGGEEPGPIGDWLCFTAEEANSTVQLNRVGSISLLSLEYSYDGSKWIDYSWSGSTGDVLLLSGVGDKVYLRAKTPNAEIASFNNRCHTVVGTGKFSVSGSPYTLFNKDGVEQLPSGGIQSLFRNCTSLVDASELGLSATYVGAAGYANMFQGCTSLTAAPAELPVVSAGNYAFSEMFRGCTSLSTVEFEIPLSSNFPEGMCKQMFYGCTSLTDAPKLCAPNFSSREGYNQTFYGCTHLSSMNVALTAWPTGVQATNNWVNGVAATGTFICPAELPDIRGTSNIPVGWTVVHPEQEISAVCFTAEQANSQVWFKSGGQTRYFETSTDGQNWSTYTLDTHISLPNVGDKVYFRAATGQTNTLVGISWIGGTAFAGSGKLAGSGDVKYLISQDGDTSQVAKHCFEGAFKNMTSLVTAPKLGLSALTESCYANMFDGCTSLIAAPDIPATTLDYHSCINTFAGCRSLSAAPALPATTLATWVYDGMFSNCSSLTAAPALPATTLVEGCYKNMFLNCRSLSAAPALPATTIASNCYESMFQGCTSLTAAPALPAETLASNCYLNMLSGCSNIASIDVSFSAWNPTNATTNWVTNVAATGTFICPAELPDIRGTSNIPTGWTKVDAV